MSLPTVSVNQTSGGTGRALPGYDYYSAMQFYGTAPVVSGKWATSTNTPAVKTQEIFSVSDATAAGIIPYTDNTASTATHALVRGATGDILHLWVEVPAPNSTVTIVELCTYTQVTGDSSNTLLGDSVAAAINAGTINHGWTAVNASGTLTLTAPKSAGISLNTGSPYKKAITGTITDTITQNVVAGTGSQWALWMYHISEFFRIFSKGIIWASVRATSSSFNELGVVQGISGNKIRQFGVQETDATRSSAANISATILSLKTAERVTDATAPYVIVYSPNIAAVADLSTLPDQNLNTADVVQVVISQDGAAAGALLFLHLGQSVGNMGAKLASIAASRVSASDAEPIDANNMSNGIENNTPAFANGLLSTDVTDGLQTQLNNYHFTYFRQFGDTVIGSYWNDNKTCIVESSDYCNVNDNRVMQKIRRIIYSTMIPKLNSEVYFNADGTLQTHSIESFKDSINGAVSSSMIIGFGANPLISGFSSDIDPTQKIKITQNLQITCVVNENGIARSITVSVSYGNA